MRGLALLALASSACVKLATSYTCAHDADCASGGVAGFCELDGACSFADATCASGRRYGDDAGGQAGTCTAGVDLSAARKLCVAGPARAADEPCAADVCASEPSCCAVSWDDQCRLLAEARCDLACDEVVAGAGWSQTSVFELAAPKTALWSSNHSGWTNDVKWADADGDGNPELAVACDASASTHGVALYAGAGIVDGTMVLEPAQIAGDQVGNTDTVEWRDFDRDGDLDVLASGTGGTFLVEATTTGYVSHRIVEGASSAIWVDADGAPPYSIVIAYHTQTNARTALHMMTAGFTLDAITQANTLAMMGTWNHEWCDLTGDGKRDLVANGLVWIAAGAGFTTGTALQNGGYDFACADLDDDRDNDLVVADYTGPVRVVRNEGGISGIPSFTTAATVRIGGFAIADVDDNGRLDIVVANSIDEAAEVPLVQLTNVGTPDSETWFTESTLPDYNSSARNATGLAVGPRPSTN